MNMTSARTDGTTLSLPDGTPLPGVPATDINLTACPAPAGAAGRDNLLLGLRSEDLFPAEDGPIRARVDIVEALGPGTLAHCHLDHGEMGIEGNTEHLIVRLPGLHRPASGEALRLAVRPAHGHVFHKATGLRCR